MLYFTVIFIVCLLGLILFLSLKKEKNTQKILPMTERIKKLYSEYQRYGNELSFFNESLEKYEEYLTINKATAYMNLYSNYFLMYTKLYNYLSDKSLIKNMLSQGLESYNNRFIEIESKKYDELFSNIDNKSLDIQQRKAVIVNEEANLVVAGAGSGKTLTVAGKVKYLVETKGVKPSEILLISFTKAAAQEMNQRIKGKLKIQVEAVTFHKLGLMILSSFQEKINVFDNPNEILNRESLQKILKNNYEYALSFLEYISYFATDKSNSKSHNNFFNDESSHFTYRDRLLKNRDNSIKNDEIETLAERDIANFLFLNQINYIYQPSQKKEKINSKFIFPDYNLEFEIQEETKTSDLLSFLEKNSITLNPFTQEELNIHMEYLVTSKEINSFLRVVKTFLMLFKSNNFKLEDIDNFKEKSKKLDEYTNKKHSLFFYLYLPLFKEYSKVITSENIDFNDMINLAIDTLESSDKIKLPYKYIIVDEYQDTSVSKYKLLKAIINKTNAKITMVGDDWQSIYRFAGADVDLFTNFKKYFKYNTINFIEKTYRNSQNLIDVGQTFILSNPTQIKKNLKSDKKLEKPIHLYFLDSKCKFDIFLLSLIQKLEKEYKEKKDFSILILTRNNSTIFKLMLDLKLANVEFQNQKDSDKIIEKLSSQDKTLEPEEQNRLMSDLMSGNIFFKSKFIKSTVQIMTVHKSKGLEADEVIILDLNDNATGFPNKLEDDSVLRYVLSSKDDFQFSEERRLFYVALTRTRNKVHLIATQGSPSCFITEIKEKINKEIYEPKEYKDNTIYALTCPQCGGRLIEKENSKNNRKFVGCSNYPKCNFTLELSSEDFTLKKSSPKLCPVCKSSKLIKSNFDNYYYCPNYNRKNEKTHYTISEKEFIKKMEIFKKEKSKDN